MNNDTLLFEACVETLDEALLAEKNGAHRIELCSHLELDGLTPSAELTRQCVSQLTIPVMAMVRPRGGDFCHTEEELKQMEQEIDYFKQSGVAGVVFGLLTSDRQIDVQNTIRLTQRANPLQVTFHKAIDFTPDVLGSFAELNEISGITRVLTSGGMDTAWNGRHIIKAMQDLPQRKIRIIAAGKVLPDNRETIAGFTGVSELHGKRIVAS